MKLRVSRCLSVISLIAFAISFALPASAADVDPATPLAVDPHVKMGTLPNKMNYWIRAHKTPPGKVNIWMHVGSGSINEDDNQRGLAHFLEHMAFNGSEHFAAGTLVKYFESLGLQFGRDQNAFTSFDQTTYKLTLPDTKPETLEKGLQCLADFGYRLLLPNDKLETERGVILEEARTRKGASQRIIEKLLPLVAPGSRFADRLPIGQEDVIKTADRQRFVDYYSKWYRPDDTTLIVVGDIDPDAIEKMIVENFSDWKPVEKAATDTDPGIKDYTTERAGVITDPELEKTEISVARIGPLTPLLTNGDFRREMVEDLGGWIINRRYNEMVEKGIAPFQNAGLGISPFLNVCRYYDAQCTGGGDGKDIKADSQKWSEMLTALLVEMKRVREFGFLQQELDDAKKETLAGAQQSAQTEATWDAQSFVNSMNSDIARKIKPMSAAQRLELIAALLPGITREEVTESFKKNFDPKARLLLITMPQKDGFTIPTEAQILEAASKAEAVKVDAPKEKERPKSLLETEPAPGAVAAKEEDPDLHILSATLNNGVRVHVRNMDFKKNMVMAQLSIAGGGIRETAANKGITDAAALLLNQPATAKLTSTTIREMMTGKKVAVSGGAGQDNIVVSISGTPEDIEEGFRLMYLIMTQGKLEESALKVWKEENAQQIEKRKTNVEAQLREKFSALISGDDPRVKPISREQLDKITVADAQAWIDAIFKSGPIEAAIVGDIEQGRAMDLAQKYLGSLPKRELVDDSLTALRKIDEKSGPQTATVGVETITPRAVVLTGWRGADWTNVKDRRILQLAGELLSTRLREEIREKRSLAYSPACISQPSKSYKGMGFIAAYFQADPEKAGQAASISEELIEKFAKEGPTDAELDAVRKQFKNSLETQLKEPSYWASVLADLDYRGTKLSDVKEVVEKFSTYSKDEILEVLKRYITPERHIQVITVPTKGGAAGAKDVEKK